MAKFKKLPFSKVVKDVTRNYSKIPKTEYLKEGLYPIVDQGKDFICGYTNDLQKVTETDKPIIIFGDHTRIFKFIDFPVAIGADGVKVLKVDSSLADEEFIYEYLRTINLHNAGYSRHFKYLKEVKIPVPDSIAAQKRVATVLQKTDSLINQRKESIDLADEILKNTFLTTFGDPFSNPLNLPKRRIIEFTPVETGSTPSRKKKDTYYSKTGHNWVTTTQVNGTVIEEDTPERITDLAIKETNCKIFPENTILIAMYGQGKTRGQAGLLKIQAATNQACAAILPSNEFNSTFLFHQLLYSYPYLRELGRGGGQPNLNLSIVKNYQVLFPKPAKQSEYEKIVLQINKLKSHYNSSLVELRALYKSLSHKAFNGDLTIIEKIEIEGTIKIEPKISATLEVIEQKQPITTIPEPVKKKEEVPASITHIPFLRTEEDLLSHISRNCSGSHFTFEDIKEAVKGLGWTYDFEELKNLVFSLVRNKQLKQVFADASYKAGFNKTDGAFKEIADLSEQIYFKRML